MFDTVLTKLKKNGWREQCPSRSCWTFTKRNWTCKLFWSYGEVAIYRNAPTIKPRLIEMKIPKGRIEDVVAKRSNQTVLAEGAYLDAKDKMLYASDGHMVVVVPVEVEDSDASGFIALDDLKAARRKPATSLTTDPNDKRFPVKNVKQFLQTQTFNDPVVSLDAERLYKLARAICDGGDLHVKIYLPLNVSDGMIVKPVHPSDQTGMGVLMPVDESGAHRFHKILSELCTWIKTFAP